MSKSICMSGRQRLDKTLATPALAEKDNLKQLIRQQILNSSLPNAEVIDAKGDPKGVREFDSIVETHVNEVWSTVELIRSASENSAHKPKAHQWKLKEDNEQFRTMYREGPAGTPFHTLLVEGFVNGPLEICMGLGVEPSLYPHWFPQITLPTFKIIESRCLKRIRIGEEISLVRFKVPWPLPNRELIFRYFELEYLTEDLVIVVLKSVPDLNSIDEKIDEFNANDIPSQNDAIRMDIRGGFVLQQVNSSQCYFRTIANLDIKLDFVPPWLINFISRQLIGHGFRLYQEAVTAASKGDKLFHDIIEHGPLYVRIRASQQRSKEDSKQEIMPRGISTCKELGYSNDGSNSGDGETLQKCDNEGSNSGSTCEIIEVATDVPVPSEPRKCMFPSQSVTVTRSSHKERSMDNVDPAMQKALKVLDDAIIFAKAYSANRASVQHATNGNLLQNSRIKNFKMSNGSLLDKNTRNDGVQPMQRNCNRIASHEKKYFTPPQTPDETLNNRSRISFVESRKASCLPFLCFSKK